MADPDVLARLGQLSPAAIGSGARRTVVAAIAEIKTLRAEIVGLRSDVARLTAERDEMRSTLNLWEASRHGD